MYLLITWNSVDIISFMLNWETGFWTPVFCLTIYCWLRLFKIKRQNVSPKYSSITPNVAKTFPQLTKSMLYLRWMCSTILPPVSALIKLILKSFTWLWNTSSIIIYYRLCCNLWSCWYKSGMKITSYYYHYIVSGRASHYSTTQLL